MNLGKDNLNANSSLHINVYGENKDLIEVRVETIDDIAIHTQSFPNVVKIDVEGYELGIKELLKC